jgi:phage-related protein
MKKITAKFYRNISGKEPVREFLKEMKKADKVIIGEDIQTVEYGWPIGMPVCRPLGDGLFEVRSTITSGNEVRVMFAMIDNMMILLHAFIKKSQKTPEKELAIARTRKKEVKNG